MRAVVLDADGRPRLTDVPEPAAPLQVLACGLCGSDVEKLGSAAPGVVLGHEVVVRDGERRLALVHHRPCGECAQCLAGHESTCEHFAEPTIRPGGFAERVEATEGVELPAELDDVRGTMVEPLACVLRGAAHVPHGRVLVIGQGFVGRLFVSVLERRGDEVFAADSDPARTGRLPSEPVDAVVVCARGAGRDALRAVAPGGTVLVFADAGELPGEEVYRRELQIVGSRSATPQAMREAVQLLPLLDVPEPTVLPLARFDEGLALYRERRALKVVFTP